MLSAPDLDKAFPLKLGLSGPCFCGKSNRVSRHECPFCRPCSWSCRESRTSLRTWNAEVAAGSFITFAVDISETHWGKHEASQSVWPSCSACAQSRQRWSLVQCKNLCLEFYNIPQMRLGEHSSLLVLWLWGSLCLITPLHDFVHFLPEICWCLRTWSSHTRRNCSFLTIYFLNLAPLPQWGGGKYLTPGVF